VIEIELRGLETVEKFFATMPERSEKALRLAVNAAAMYGARQGKQAIMKQLNFTSAYLGNPADPKARLGVVKRAKAGDLEAVIEARHRATSLARFGVGAPSFGKQKQAVRVQVKKGVTKTLKRAFYLRLNAGSASARTDENYNLGIAVRLKPGEKIGNKKVHKSKNGRYEVLYGPSVEQAFNSVSVDISDDVLKFAETEFLRQFGRDNL
jgi:hypothetical protein